MLRVASPHRGKVDSDLQQVTHWLEINTSYNPTSEDPNYHFNIEHMSEIFTHVLNSFSAKTLNLVLQKNVAFEDDLGSGYRCQQNVTKKTTKL